MRPRPIPRGNYRWKPKAKCCVTCHIDFVPEMRNGSRQRFCSRTCKWTEENRKRSEPKRKKCSLCGNQTLLPPRQRLCSDECRREGRRLAHLKAAEKTKALYVARGRSFRPAKVITGVCLNCGAQFRKFARHFVSKSPPKYCGLDCYIAHTRVRVSPLSRGDDFYRGRNWRRIRVTIRTRDENVCQSCGGRATPVRKLSVDHVIPYRLMDLWNLEANAEGNLLTVCDSCHSRKTNIAEPKLFRGDVIGFLSDLLTMHYPITAIRTACDLAGLSTRSLDRIVDENL